MQLLNELINKAVFILADKTKCNDVSVVGMIIFFTCGGIIIFANILMKEYFRFTTKGRAFERRLNKSMDKIMFWGFLAGALYALIRLMGWDK